MKYYYKKGLSLIEILLVLAILSMSLFPLSHILTLAKPVDLHTDDEYMATLLAQHVMESIIAKRKINLSYLPAMSDFKPIVSSSINQEPISEYFNYFSEFNGPVSEVNNPQLYWEINKYKCKVDTYLLDDNLFKVIVYISYTQNDREMKVYLERLFVQNESLPFENDNIKEED